MLHILTLFLLLAHLATSAAQEARTKYNFNSDWKVLVGDPTDAETPDFDDSSWKNVTTPYAWNEDEAFRLDIANLSTGVAWYRKHFQLPNVTESKKVFLEFEGIRHGGEFYLNGKWIGRSENGVMAFGFDITDFILPGKVNVLAAHIDSSWDYREVATNTRYQWNDRNFYANYGGINKNVYLHVTDKLYQTLPLYSNLETTGVYIYAQDINIGQKSANITAETQIRNEYNTSKSFSYQVIIQDIDKKTIKTITGKDQTLVANKTATVGLSDTVGGLNFWSWGYGYLYTVHTIISVNGKEIDRVTTQTGFRKTAFEKGMFKLNDRTLHLKGYAQRSTNEWVALGNSVPAWVSDFSNQLVLESHGALVRWMHVTPWKQDVESFDRLGLLQSMPAGDSESDVTGRRWEQRVEVMRDAIIYNRNNPSVIFYEAGNKGISEDHMTQMHDIRDTYDPHGGRASGCREMLNSTVAEFGGEMLYINKGARIPLWQMEYSRDEGLRKYWDEFSPPYHKDGDGPLHNGEDASTYNRNQDSHAVEDAVRWYDYYEMRPGTGNRVNGGGVNIIFSDSNTHHRGAENYRRSGEVDPVRLPKDGWYAHQVMWNTWVDIEVQAAHIIGHWNYATGSVKNVYVISTADKIELQLNGKSLGFGNQTHQFVFTFANVTYEPGELKALGYTESSKTSKVLDTKTTSGEPVAIRLTSHVSPTGFYADGADLALVDVEVVDKDGKRCPIALNTIKFTLEGEASWLGGIAQGPDNYIHATSLPVENGVNRVILRSTTTAGKITLKAESENFSSASLTLKTKDFSSDHGLSTYIAASDLPSSLVRGPAPSGESYTLKRQALKIVSVEAGTDSSIVENTFDDDELTQWSISSPTSDAWIKYTLEKTAEIDQVVMKMAKFQSKKYEVVVSVDDKVVYTETTPTSLGYVTLTFNATKGKTVKIASGDDDATGDLGIIEAEIYAPL